MTKVGLPEVEDRLRATLQERSHDVAARLQPPGDAVDVAELVSLRPSGRGFGARLVTVAAVAVGVIVIGAVAAAWVDRGDDDVVSGTESPATSSPPVTGDAPTPGPSVCAMPVEVAVPGALRGPVDGPAPGGEPAGDGQSVVHWPTADGVVELRWPAPPVPVYGTGRTPSAALDVSEMASPGRVELDVHQRIGADDPGIMFEPDVVIGPWQAANVIDRPQCERFAMSVITSAGRWDGGFARTPNGSDVPVELVDVQPRIIEQRAVDVAPTAAIRCQGADANGTPPNKSGGPDPAMRGPEPADVLLQYLAATPTAVPSGYVEMQEPDGSITYGVDPAGIGWTTLLFVIHDANGWYLEGWTASGC